MQSKTERDMARRALEEGLDIRRALITHMLGIIVEAGTMMRRALRSGRKVVLFGNGGSAADAQHIAAELVGRFVKERAPLPAIALSTDTSALTAIGNDYGFDQVFRRQVTALVSTGDVVVGISTSGNSSNVIQGMKEAARRKAKTIALLGGDGGALKALVELPLVVPSYSTPRIQEAHIAIGHILCELAERP